MFRVTGLAPGKYKIRLSDFSLLNVAPDTEYEVRAGAETPAEVRVSTGAIISGRVYDPATGEGVEGVAVVGAARIDPNAAPVVTNANGEYTISGVRPGTYGLAAAAILLPDGGHEPASAADTMVGVASGEVQEGADIAMGTVNPVKGVVVDVQGQPVAGAIVQSYGRMFRRTTTDESGRYRFSDERFSSEVKLYARKGEWHSDIISVKGGPNDVVVKLDLSGTAAVYGTACTAEGKPLAIYFARALRVDDATGKTGPFRFASEYTTATGDFALENLPAGSYDLVIEKSREEIRKRVTLGNGQVLRNLRLQCQPEGQLAQLPQLGGRFLRNQPLPDS